MTYKDETAVALPKKLVARVKILCARRGCSIKMWVIAQLERCLKEGN
jgi:hypothetical protein